MQFNNYNEFMTVTQKYVNANGTFFQHLYHHDTWGELLVLHQGTQALITVSGALFFSVKTLVPLGSTTVQTTE